jgi:uncharacterized membrane protein YqjE
VSSQDLQAGAPVPPVPASTSRAAEQADERSLGEIVHDIAGDLSTLVRQELDLAKTEMKEEATRAGRGVGLLGGAGVAGHLMQIFLSLALTYLLDNWMPVELAALITAGLWLIVAAVLGVKGRKALQQTNPQLPETQRSLKEDARWAKQQTS